MRIQIAARRSRACSFKRSGYLPGEALLDGHRRIRPGHGRRYCSGFRDLDRRRSGIGKSTIVLQAGCALARAGLKVLYVSGEEIGTLPVKAQQKRLSPHETISAVIDGNRVTVTYGRPYTKSPRTGEVRKIWGGLVLYGKPWRMGADEATQLTTQEPIVMGGKAIPAGAYTLYMIPQESGASQLVISTRIGRWGIPVDQSHDLARVDLKKEALDKPVDQFTITIQKKSSGAGELNLMWENTQFSGHSRSRNDAAWSRFRHSV